MNYKETDAKLLIDNVCDSFGLVEKIGQVWK